MVHASAAVPSPYSLASFVSAIETGWKVSDETWGTRMSNTNMYDPGSCLIRVGVRHEVGIRYDELPQVSFIVVVL